MTPPTLSRRGLLAAGLAAACPRWALAADEAPVVRFATADEAAEAIAYGTDRAYIDALNRREMQARMPQLDTALDATAARAALRRFYASQVLPFDDAARDALRTLATALQPRLAQRAPWLARTPWSFLQISDRIEGGMPHTRGPWIVLPQGFVRLIVQFAHGAPAASGFPRGTNVVLHEQVHVLQRGAPTRFESLYADVFGFVRMDPVPHSAWLDEHVVTNPDAPVLDWVWPQDGTRGARRGVLPATVLPERPVSSLQQMTTVAVPAEERDGRWALPDGDGQRTVVPLDRVPGYAARFPWTSENFHPNEIAAELVAGWLLDAPSFKTPSPVTDPAVAWLRSHLG
jgi:hypothetical protein